MQNEAPVQELSKVFRASWRTSASWESHKALVFQGGLLSFRGFIKHSCMGFCKATCRKWTPWSTSFCKGSLSRDLWSSTKYWSFMKSFKALVIHKTHGLCKGYGDFGDLLNRSYLCKLTTHLTYKGCGSTYHSIPINCFWYIPCTQPDPIRLWGLVNMTFLCRSGPLIQFLVTMFKQIDPISTQSGLSKPHMYGASQSTPCIFGKRPKCIRWDPHKVPRCFAKPPWMGLHEASLISVGKKE